MKRDHFYHSHQKMIEVSAPRSFLQMIGLEHMNSVTSPRGTAADSHKFFLVIDAQRQSLQFHS